MKLIIAGSRTFTDYQLLCQVLAPDRHRIWDGQSPGTAHLIQCMRALGKPVVLVSSDTTA